MRLITTHKLNGLNDAIIISATDDPGIESHRDVGRLFSCDISFQNGPIAESGFNGISNEALVAIVIDRLQGFQSALTHLEDAMHWLQHRTRQRLVRGVEGTSAV